MSYRIRLGALRMFLPGLILSAPISGYANEATQPALEEVIVTARKRAENMQTTPISVTSISGADIENAKLFNLRDLATVAPNLSTPASNDGGSGTFQAYIRGVGQFDFALTTDPGVGVYIDGVYLARVVAANLEFSDVEQIAVLRGPQGTLFGKNTIGGAIQVVTRKPAGEPRLSATVTGGDLQYRAFNSYAEFPITDHIAGSVSVLAKQSDGWQKRKRGDNAGNENVWGARAHLRIDFSSTWSAHLIVDHTDVDQNAYPHVLLDFDPNAAIPPLYNLLVVGPFNEPCCTPNTDIDRSDVLNEKDREQTKSTGLTLDNTWDIADLTFKSITGIRKLDAEMYRDSDNSELDYFSVESIFDTASYSQEFLLSNPDGNAFEWTVGLYYMYETGQHISNVVVAGGLYDRVQIQPSLTDWMLFYDRRQDTWSAAAFGNATWHVTDSIAINFGARYTEDKKELEMFTLRLASQTPIVEPGPTRPKSCGDVVADGNGSSYRCEDTWKNFSPKIGIDKKLGDSAMMYGHISKGFRSGVYNGRPIENRHISVADPELLSSYEVGFKSRFWSNRVQLNGAYFYNDYKDQQLLVIQSAQTAAGSLALVVDNAADAVMQGAEIELTVLPLSSLLVTAGLGWTDAEYKEFMAVDPDTGEDVDLSDRHFSHVPEWTANLMLQYTYGFDNGAEISIRGDAAYRSDIYYNNDRESRAYDLLHVSGYATYNAGVTLTSPRRAWQLSIFGRNVSDRREINGGFDVGAFGVTDVSYTEPMRIYASLKYTGEY